MRYQIYQSVPCDLEGGYEWEPLYLPRQLKQCEYIVNYLRTEFPMYYEMLILPINERPPAA